MIKKSFPILALSIFSSMLGVGIIVPLLPLYAENLGASGTGIGLIFAAYAISNIVATPIIGRLSDRRGRKLLLGIGLFSYSIISLGYMWVNSVWQLILLRLIQGAAGGMIQPIAQAYTGDISPEGEEGKWMGYFNFSFWAGFGGGPLLGGVLTDHFGMNASFYTMAGLNLLAFLIVAFFLPEIKQRKITSSPRSSFKEMSTSSMVKGIFSYQVTFAVGNGTFTTFLPIFAGIYLGLSPTLIGVLLAANTLLMALLQLYSGNVADRFNRKILVVLGGLINFIYLALIPRGGNFWQLLGICALGGISWAIATSAASALSVEEGRRFGMGSTMAVLIMAFSIGMAAGALLGGVIADFVNIDSVFYFGAGAGLIGTVLFIWFARR